MCEASMGDFTQITVVPPPGRGRTNPQFPPGSIFLFPAYGGRDFFIFLTSFLIDFLTHLFQNFTHSSNPLFTFFKKSRSVCQYAVVHFRRGGAGKTVHQLSDGGIVPVRPVYIRLPHLYPITFLLFFQGGHKNRLEQIAPGGCHWNYTVAEYLVAVSIRLPLSS